MAGTSERKVAFRCCQPLTLQVPQQHVPLLCVEHLGGQVVGQVHAEGQGVRIEQGVAHILHHQTSHGSRQHCPAGFCCASWRICAQRLQPGRPACQGGVPFTSVQLPAKPCWMQLCQWASEHSAFQQTVHYEGQVGKSWQLSALP